MYNQVFKRIFDFTVALILLILLLPVMIITTVILLFVNNGKPFFTQLRPGRHEKIFAILKFKSMNDKTDKDGNLLPDTYRLTNFGRFIRKTSIDEFPQLINVLKGEMSLVGPRPLLIRYLPYYTEEELIRYTVRPGITGLAQISGRNLLDWDSKLKKDIEYVRNLSFRQDCYILYQTFWKIIRPEGVVVDQDSHPDMLALDLVRADRKIR